MANSPFVTSFTFMDGTLPLTMSWHTRHPVHNSQSPLDGSLERFRMTELTFTIRKSSTPTSLIALLYPSFPAPYRSPLARFAFRHVYVDASQRGLYKSKDLVSFSGRDLMNTIAPSSTSTSTSASGKLGLDGKVDMDMELDDTPGDRGGGGNANGTGRKKVVEKSLDEYGFITGDYLSVSLYVPEPKGPPPTITGPGAGAGAGVGSGPSRDREQRGGGGGGPPANGEWARGEALPPQRGGYAGGPPRDRRERDGGYRGGRGEHQAGGMGMGIRGGAGRRRSPSIERNGNGGGSGRRSRSPDYNRRRDRSP